MTLENDFNTLISEMENNLQTMGVTDAEFNPRTGIRGLTARILDIEPSIGGLDLDTALSLSSSSSSVIVGESIILTSKLTASYDDETLVNVDLEGVLQSATVLFKNGDIIIGTGVTDINGVATCTYTTTSVGTLNIKAFFEGTDNFKDCESSSVSVVVNNLDFDGIELTSDKDIISYNAGINPEHATLTAQLTLDDEPVAVAGETVTFEVRKNSDDSLVETLTEYTDEFGVATVSYYGKGVGDIYIKAECRSLTKTFVIQDCSLYRPNPVACTSCNIDLPSSALISYKMSKPRLDGAYGGINLQLIDSSHTYFVGNWSSQGNNGLLIRNTGSSTNLVSQTCSDVTANTESLLGITYDNGAWPYFKDNEVKSFSANYTPTKLDIIQVQQGTIKDLMIKPL